MSQRTVLRAQRQTVSLKHQSQINPDLSLSRQLNSVCRVITSDAFEGLQRQTLLLVLVLTCEYSITL